MDRLSQQERKRCVGSLDQAALNFNLPLFILKGLTKMEKSGIGLAGGNTAGVSGQANFLAEQDFEKKE